jgi:NhaA family Na+:H+ antiporter
MSLFIASLAFNRPESLAMAKVGILVASLIAGLAGFWLLRRIPATASHEQVEGRGSTR